MMHPRTTGEETSHGEAKTAQNEKTHSQSTVARPRLTLGDSVRVKDGVMDPDYDGCSIGGWSDEIVAFETWEQTPMALIEWDASTQRDRMAPEGKACREPRPIDCSNVAASERLRTRGRGQRDSALRGAAEGARVEPSARSWTPRLVVMAIPMCCGFATRCEPMGRLCG